MGAGAPLNRSQVVCAWDGLSFHSCDLQMASEGVDINAREGALPSRKYQEMMVREGSEVSCLL